MATRRRVIAGNWKMYKTLKEARDYAGEFLDQVSDVTELDIVLCPPFTTLAVLKDELEESIVHLGAQNMSWAEEGAFTGEISPKMLLDVACTYVILGHSERRELLHESDEDIVKKVKTALAVGLTPILCVGENLAQREENRALGVIRGQVQRDLAELSIDELRRIVIAYEPIWAIGTGRTASAHDAQEMCNGIRSALAAIAGPVADEVTILYGGSVKENNIAELMAQPDIDGALVGGASLDPSGFARLIQNAR